MTQHQQVIAIVASALVMAFTFELVRRRRLREEYSMLWLAAGLVLLVLSIDSGLITWMAGVLGIQHPAYSLFVIALFIGMILALHFTLVLSKLTAQNWRLNQEIALLKQRLDQVAPQVEELSDLELAGGPGEPTRQSAN